MSVPTDVCINLFPFYSAIILKMQKQAYLLYTMEKQIKISGTMLKIWR